MAAGPAPWWAVQVTLARRGTQIQYVQATSRQSAAQVAGPGSTVLGGPYPSEAEAQAHFPQGSAGSVPAVAGQTTPPTVVATPSDPLGFLGGLTGIAHWLGVAVTDLTDWHLWASLGWLFLGFVLLIVGLLLFLKHEDLLPKGVPIPVPV